MQDIDFAESQIETRETRDPSLPECDECIGTGGWYRYDPALEPSQGRLYLSCLQCRGTGALPAALRA